MLEPPSDSDTWLLLTDQVLSAGVVSDWAVRPDCGAVVVFSGTARDHAEGRADVRLLEYEAYEEQVVPRLAAIGPRPADAGPRPDGSGCSAAPGRSRSARPRSSSPRQLPIKDEAFEAARFCIDTLKSSVPIWKRETWADGSEWGLDAKDLVEVPEGERS